MNAEVSKSVCIGLSGGVDSAVSAALLQQAGFAVEGVFAFIALPGYYCTAKDDRRDALRAAAHLGIPFKEIDLSQSYERAVFKQALSAYRRGETPNPDALCNREIKFGLLFDWAMENGADFFATGHYARTKSGRGGGKTETQLLAGKDSDKDQSYFLWAVPQEKLKKTLFPVGNFHKSRVRALAQQFNLPNAARKDSQGLCFVGNIPFDEVLARELHPAKGLVVDAQGRCVGTHRGAALYTMGQRHGFTLAARARDEKPRYVIGKNMEQNTITVAPLRERKDPPAGEIRFERTIRLREENWIGDAPPGAYRARFRYRQTLLKARLNRRAAGASVVVLEGAAPLPTGQSLVLYDKDRCLGGGIIDGVVEE